MKRVGVVDTSGTPLMPCTPAKARALLKQGKASPRWSKLGVFYVQLKYAQEPSNQALAAGVDPGSRFEGYAVVGTKDTALNLMAEAPAWAKSAVATRREMRRARRYRKTRRRPCRFDNRLTGRSLLPPSTRARWEAKAHVIAEIRKIYPITYVVVEDVQAKTRKGQRRWNKNFSPVQVGKEHLYQLLVLLR